MPPQRDGQRVARTTISPPPSDMASGLSCLRVRNGHTSRSHRSRLLPSPGLRPDRAGKRARTDPAANSLSPLSRYGHGDPVICRMPQSAPLQSSVPVGEQLRRARYGGAGLGLARQDVVVVSGGAFGIDATAHRAVSPLRKHDDRLRRRHRRPYPSLNAMLFKQAEVGGLVVSESPPGSAASPSLSDSQPSDRGAIHRHRRYGGGRSLRCVEHGRALHPAGSATDGGARATFAMSAGFHRLCVRIQRRRCWLPQVVEYWPSSGPSGRA